MNDALLDIGNTPNPNRPAILLVDDEQTALLSLYELFKDDNDVFMATSGEEALTFCQSRLPDLILLDMLMPGMDGLAVCKQLKSSLRTEDIPVIVVTVSTGLDIETEALDAGAVDFINKPINPDVVRARVRTHLKLKRQTDLLRNLAKTDGLTGAANRRNFDETLAREWQRCMRAQAPLSIIYLDVDHFKAYNDHYGHLAGDQCLQAIANTLMKNLHRPPDMLARYGGEEFVCLLPETPFEGGTNKASILEQAIRALAIPHVCSPTAPVVTISLGVTCIVPSQQHAITELMQQADALLYEAKQAGRGCYRATALH